jgi:cation:H+ antiporter
MSSVLLVVAGLVVLLTGAEVLVRGGTGLAASFGVSPMLIGLTVVSLGTSVPELAVGIDAAVSGSPGLAVGNIVGTNLVNILFILGLSALLVPVALQARTLRFDLPAMTAAAVVLVLLSLDGALDRVDGLVLLLGGVVYTVLLVWRERGERGGEPASGTSDGIGGSVVRLVLGIVAVVVGAELLVEGAVAGAESLGVSEAVTGLTVVAIGTSAPELVTTLMATARGDRDLALGNLVGSSTYNIALVLGLTAVVAPDGLPIPDEVLASDLVLLLAAALATLPVFLTGSRISRAEGALFVSVYVGYVTWLVVART